MSSEEARGSCLFHVTILTIHPEFCLQSKGFGPIASAEKFGSLKLRVVDLRDYAQNSYRSVDDRPYGGGDGMIMSPEPLARALQTLSPYDRVIFTTPGAPLWNHNLVREQCLDILQKNTHWVFICGRFGGIDQRFIDRYVTHQYSLGPYVISGGELAVLTMIDSMVRHLPGAMSDPKSATTDSFEDTLDGLVEYPLYTRPAVFEGVEVPAVLLGGNHSEIELWRKKHRRPVPTL